MNPDKNTAKMFVLCGAGFLVILSVGLRQTPRNADKLKYRAFLCAYILENYKVRGVSEKPLIE